MASQQPPILLWCHPRSVSTAFERAFLQRDSRFCCLHEPFSDAYYFGPERISTRYSDVPHDDPRRHATFESCLQSILQREGSSAARGNRRGFVKDMAYYVVRRQSNGTSGVNPTIIPTSSLQQMQHTFLIRTPKKSIPSFYKLCVGEGLKQTGFEFFDDREAGYEELRVLFDYVRQSLGKESIVVDADDLLENPEGVMATYCKAVGEDFDRSMITWEPRQVEEFQKWPGFHEEVQRSMGFGKIMEQQLESGNRPPQMHEDLPAELRKCIQRNMGHYEYLRRFTMRPLTSNGK